MKIFILGGTGFIGQHLCRGFLKRGHEVTLLVRSNKSLVKLPPGATAVLGDPLKGGDWQNIAREADVIINLVGETIFHRWTEEYKKRLWDSRIESTRRAVECLTAGKILFNASAVGYYGDRGEEELDEGSSPGEGFVVKLCLAWEEEALKGLSKGAQVFITRFGIVLGKGGGMLKTVLPIFKLGLGGRLGSGKQWFPWVHVEDILQAMLFLLEKNAEPGVYNFVSPNPIRNVDFTKILAKVLKRPALFPVPKFALKLIYGELADVIMASAKVIPRKLLNLGYQFKYPDFETALVNSL